VSYLLLLAGFVFHTTAMWRRGFSLDRCPVNNLFEATMFIAWTIVATYLAIGLWSRVRFLGAFASPVLLALGVFALNRQLDTPHGRTSEAVDAWTSVHAALVLLGYGAFGLSAIAGLMFLTQDHDLRFRKLRAVFSLMPPIERLSMVIGRLAVAGFTLLTLGMLVGAVWARKPVGISLLADTKVIWSVLVWMLYGLLLIMRWRSAQGGRRIAWASVGIFAFVMLTFWGTNLLSVVHRP
jgi:ABC-type transport system involved in cytochrome c biogenesis permease subunit